MIQRTNLNMDKLFERNFKKVKKDGKVFYTRVEITGTDYCLHKALVLNEEKKFLGLFKYKKKNSLKIIDF